MKTIKLSACQLLLLVLGLGPPAWAAGTCVVSDVTSSQIAAESNRISDASTVIVTLTCTGDASTGSFPATSVPLSGSYPTALLNTYNLTGYLLYQVKRTPGTTQPTGNYSVTVKDADSFALDLGLLTSNGSASASQLVAITNATNGPPVVESALTVAITGNSVASANIRVDLVFRLPPLASLSGGPLTATSLTLGSGGTSEFLGAVSTFPGIWLGTNVASPSTTNYAMLTDGSSTLLNSPASSVSIRIANTAILDSASTVITAHVPLLATGTQTVSGCSLTSALGGSWAGSFHSGTSGTCTVTITPGNTATNGFSCWANDLTTTTDRLQQTGTLSTATATITGTTVSGDVITWGCVSF